MFCVSLIDYGNNHPDSTRSSSTAVTPRTNDDSDDDVPLSIRIDKKIKVETAEPGSFAAALLVSPKSSSKNASPQKVTMKIEDDSEDDVPLAIRHSRMNGEKSAKKRPDTSNDDDFSPVVCYRHKLNHDIDLIVLQPKKKERLSIKEDTSPHREKHKKKKKNSTGVKEETVSHVGRRKNVKKEEEEEVWKW